MLEPNESNPTIADRLANSDTLRSLASLTVIIVGTWYLLGQLGSVLRPLLLATFIGYILLPYYSQLRARRSAPMAMGILAGVFLIFLLITAAIVTSSIIELTAEAPALKTKLVKLLGRFNEWFHTLPWVGEAVPKNVTPEQDAASRIADGLLQLVNVVAVGLPEIFAAGLYTFFLLFEAGRLPERVRKSYPNDRAEEILDVFGRINAGVIRYLKAKVKASLILAIPVGVILAIVGVRFAILWAVLTFVCNFIPYIGSVVGYILPTSFAFLQLDFGVEAIVVGVLLLGMHVGTATLLEPLMIGKAVGLNPIVILTALSVWGVLWGLPGMFLAVPLTVVVKIILMQLEYTRSLGLMLDDGD